MFKVTQIKAFRYMNLFKKSGRTKAKSVFYCKEVVDTYQKVEKLRDEPPSYMYVVLVDIK